MRRALTNCLLIAAILAAVNGAWAQDLTAPNQPAPTDQDQERSTGLPRVSSGRSTSTRGGARSGSRTRCTTIRRSPGSGKPERPVVRGLRQARAVRRLHAGSSSEIYGKSVSSASEPTDRCRGVRRRTSRRSGPRICTSDGDREGIRRSARTRWTSSWAGRSTSSVTDCSSTTAPPRAAAAAATGRTRARHSSSRPSPVPARAAHRSSVLSGQGRAARRATRGSRLWGAITNTAAARTTDVGATYMKWIAEPDIEPAAMG